MKSAFLRSALKKRTPLRSDPLKLTSLAIAPLKSYRRFRPGLEWSAVGWSEGE